MFWIVIVNVEFTLGLVIEYVQIIRLGQLVAAIIDICIFVDLGTVQYRGGAVEFFLIFEVNYIIIWIKLGRCAKWKPELVINVRS